MIAEVVNDDGSMSRLPQLREFADTHDLALVSIADPMAYRRRTETVGGRGPQTRLPARCRRVPRREPRVGVVRVRGDGLEAPEMQRQILGAEIAHRFRSYFT